MSEGFRRPRDTAGSVKLEKALDRWAEARLQSIGIYSENVDARDFSAWKDKVIAGFRAVYSDQAIDMVLMTENNRKMETASVRAKITGPCGDTVEIFIKIEEGYITDASFQTDGCEPSRAACEAATRLITGLSVKEAAVRISQSAVLDFLGGLPEDGKHCALLAADTVAAALKKA